MAGSPSIEVRPLTPVIGAEVHGVDLAAAAGDEATMAAVADALSRHLVLVFPGQDLTPEGHLGFAAWFGPIETHGYAAPHPDHPEMAVIELDDPTGLGFDAWHSDSSGKPRPAMGAVLRAVELPPLGGDTCWSSMYAAYEALSAPVRRLLDGLAAVHDFARPLERAQAGGYRGSPASPAEIRAAWPPVEHPVVRTHPVTGRRGLFVNSNYTVRISGLTEVESAALLSMLFAHVGRPDFVVRHRWRPGDVVLWDNRCTQHYAVPDYVGHRRVMHRVSIEGDEPR